MSGIFNWGGDPNYELSGSNNPHDYGFTGTPGSMYVLPGEGGGIRAETGLTTPDDPSQVVIGDNAPTTTQQTKTFLDSVKDIFGGTGMGGQLGQLAAFGGLAALLNKFAGQQSQQPVGYQGGIPKYNASRTQYDTGFSTDTARLKQAVNDSLAQGFTMDQVRQGALQKFGISPQQISDAMASSVGAYRRPGQGGITYFSPIQYTASGQDLARPTAGQVIGGGTVGGGTVGGGITGGISTLPAAQADAGQSIGDVIERRTALSTPKQGVTELRQLEASSNPRNYQTIGSVGGVPLRVGTGPAESSYVWLGSSPITNLKDLEAAGKKFGFSQDEMLQATRLISDKSGYKALGADLYSPIFNAIRESLGSGYTMSQIYEGAQKNFGLTKADVDAAMRYNNVNPNRPSVMTEEEVMHLSREGLPPRGAAAGGQMPGGIAMLAQGRYLKGNGDGVSDSIPARFSGSGQEARLADGEFVIPARVVSEIGNGSSDAGARKLYAMLDRVESHAKKAKRGKPSGADRELNKLA
jgi:hypothetical protein